MSLYYFDASALVKYLEYSFIFWVRFKWVGSS